MRIDSKTPTEIRQHVYEAVAVPQYVATLSHVVVDDRLSGLRIAAVDSVSFTFNHEEFDNLGLRKYRPAPTPEQRSALERCGAMIDDHGEVIMQPGMQVIVTFTNFRVAGGRFPRAAQLYCKRS